MPYRRGWSHKATPGVIEPHGKASESTIAAIEADLQNSEGKAGVSQHRRGLQIWSQAVAAPQEVKAGGSKVVEQDDAAITASAEREEENENLYREQARLVGKDDVQIDREWNRAKELKSLRDFLKDEVEERRYNRYVRSLMGNTHAYNDAVKQTMMGDNTEQQEKSWQIDMEASPALPLPPHIDDATVDATTRQSLAWQAKYGGQEW